jgi:hypothetical protein
MGALVDGMELAAPRANEQNAVIDGDAGPAARLGHTGSETTRQENAA